MKVDFSPGYSAVRPEMVVIISDDSAQLSPVAKIGNFITGLVKLLGITALIVAGSIGAANNPEAFNQGLMMGTIMSGKR